MTDIKVLSRETVQKAKELIGCIEAVSRGPSFNEWVLIQQAAHRLKIVPTDAFEDPEPKWEPGMWAKYRHLDPFRIIEVGKSGLRGKFGWYPKCDCVSVPPPKEEKPRKQALSELAQQEQADGHYRCDLEEKPFTGEHWDDPLGDPKGNFVMLREKFYAPMLALFKRTNDLAKELTRIRELMAGKSEHQ